MSAATILTPALAFFAVASAVGVETWCLHLVWNYGYGSIGWCGTFGEKAAWELAHDVPLALMAPVLCWIVAGIVGRGVQVSRIASLLAVAAWVLALGFVRHCV